MAAKALASGMATSRPFWVTKAVVVLEVVAHADRERFPAPGSPEDVRQLEAERLVRQRERNRHHAVGLEQLEGFGNPLPRIDVGIDAQVGGVAERGVRVQHAVDDQVVFWYAVRKKLRASLMMSVTRGSS